jgi:CubicO group peptidase (beta-lactamase class C family)
MRLNSPILVWLLLVGSFFLQKDLSASPDSSTRFEAIDISETLKPFLDDKRIPGLAVSVVKGGHIVAHGIAGVRRFGTNEPLRIEDTFHIASCTKSMTATLAADLVEDGKLTWTTTIADALPELATKIRPEYRLVTLLELLAHEGHVSAYTQFGEERARQLASLPGNHTQQRLDFISQVLREDVPNMATGDEAYSNAGYAIVGVMLEQASGQSWEALIQERIFKPLAMKSARCGWPADAKTPDQPRGHWSEGSEVSVQPLTHPFLAPCLWPAGAASCSIDDLALYAADHLNGLKGRPALLTKDDYQRLHRSPTGAAAGFTLGWGIRQDTELGSIHFGAGSGGSYFVRIEIIPSRDFAVVVAANSGGAGKATSNTIAMLRSRFAQ